MTSAILDPELAGRLRAVLPYATADEQAEIEGLLESLALEARRSFWRADPVLWAHERLGSEMWSGQERIARAVQANRRVAVPTCHGIGKDWTASMLTAWVLDCHDPGEAFVVSSAPTGAQIKAVLWRELRHRFNDATRPKWQRPGKLTDLPLPGRLNMTEWVMAGELVAFGRKPAVGPAAAGELTVEAFQGIHAKVILVILDEADGIPAPIWDAANTLVTTGQGRLVAIGNPDTADSRFAEVCQPGSGWTVLRIPIWETPNFSGEAVSPELAELLVGHEWLAMMEADYGRGSARWMAKVEAQPPADQPEVQVIPPSWLARTLVERHWPEERLQPVRLGMDVGAGGNQTVLRELRGVKYGRVWRARTGDPEQAVTMAVRAIRETQATAIHVDVIGVGWGVYGPLKRLRGKAHLANVIPINAAGSPRDPHQFRNVRDEMWWSLRERCRLGLLDLTELDPKVLHQLTAIRRVDDPLGRFTVEPKDETAARLRGVSPDDADAVAMAQYSPPSHPSRTGQPETLVQTG
jgi:hypothetical protein